MSATTAGILFIALGLLLAALVLFAWNTLSKLPVYRLRSAILGPGVTRALTVCFAALVVAVGVFLLLQGD